MAKIKGANAVLDVMYKWGIDHLYGFPGGSFDSTMNAIYEMQLLSFQGFIVLFGVGSLS
ncbi:hypothetical protein ACIA4D_08490 [Lactobacillus delbrueckii subsp. bulgaricus]